MAQLHLAFPSPVAAVERQDEGKFADQFRELYLLPVLIGQFNIGETLADFKFHDCTSFYLTVKKFAAERR
jgi:hypothetical protein